MRAFTFSQFLLGASVLISLLGCNKSDPLKRLERLAVEIQNTPVELATLEARFLTRKARRVSGTLKIVMIVDTSGSNLRSFGPPPAYVQLPGTDPNGNFRFRTLKQFVDSFTTYSEEDRENIFFSLITFSSAPARLVSPFTNNLDQFKGVVQNQIDTLSDVGATDMPAALDTAYTLINNDITQSSQNQDPKKGNYVIIFVTDGKPTRGLDPIPVSEVIAQITRLKTLGLNSQLVQSLTLNTGFYCSGLCNMPEGIEGKETTRLMAEAGGGDALFFEDEGINYQRYALPVTKVKYQARDVRARNLSVNWFNGELKQDSDQDGIVDEEEALLGSDGNDRDSDGDGISDKIQRILTGKVCGSFDTNGKCVKVHSVRYDGCAPHLVSSSTRGFQYALSADHYTNKCELMQLERDPETWELGDWMPYVFRVVTGLSFDDRAGDLSLDPDKDGKNNYEEILRGTDLYTKGHESVPEYDYNMELVSSTDEYDEFHLDIKNISTVGDANLFAVYLIEHAPTGDTKRYIRVAQTRFQGKHIVLDDQDFQ